MTQKIAYLAILKNKIICPYRPYINIGHVVTILWSIEDSLYVTFSLSEAISTI